MRGGAADSGLAAAQAPEPSDLPPLRGWVVPTIPRTAVQREAAAAAERLKDLEASGASSRRIKKAAQRKLAAEERLRVAGGPTSRTLLWQIKAEEDKVEQASKAVEKELAEQRDKEKQVARLGEEIRASQALVVRLEERRKEATERLRYLSNQKWVENIPQEWVDNFRALERTLGTACPEAHPMVVALLDLMVPPPEDFDIGGDSASCSDGEGSAGGSSSATRPEASDTTGGPTAGDGTHAFGDDVQTALLRDAEAELEKLRAAWLEDKARAQAAQLSLARTAPKRTREGEEVRAGDSCDDVDMVAPLTMEQVDACYRGRCDGLVDTISQLRQRIAEEELVPPPTPADGAAPAPSETNAASEAAVPVHKPSLNSQRPPLARRGSRGRQADALAVRAEGTADGACAHSLGRTEERGKGGGRGASGRRSVDGSRGGCALGGRERGGSLLPFTRLLRQGADAEMAPVRQEALQEHRRRMRESAAAMQAQEAMQVQQDKEVSRAEQLAEAKAAIEARLGAVSPQTAESPPLVSPAYGPTGQRWDQPQGVLHHAVRLHAQERSLDTGADEDSIQRPRQRGRWAVGTDEGLPAAFRGRAALPAAFRGRRWHSLGHEGDEQYRSSRSPRPEATMALRARLTDGPGGV